MTKRHTFPLPRTLPRLWMLSDERMGDGFLPALAALPKGAGLVFRHYGLAPEARRDLLGEVRKIASARRLTVVVASKGGKHGRHRGAITAPVHSVPERIAAERAGARLVFVSPVFATTSHPSARPLGRVRFGLLIRGSKCPVVALGGMNARRTRGLAAFKIHGWAGIDAFRR